MGKTMPTATRKKWTRARGKRTSDMENASWTTEIRTKVGAPHRTESRIPAYGTSARTNRPTKKQV